MIWFTSDLHLYHNKEFLYQPRGFTNVNDMNNTIVENWNSVVQSDDDVYLLGDLMLSNTDAGIELLKTLKGHIHIILGNHDSDNRITLYKQCDNVVEVCYAKFLRYNGFHFFLCHYPTITTNKDDGKEIQQRVINLYGHTHQKENFFQGNPFMYHVGLDSHNNNLVSIDEVISDIEQKYKEYVGL